MTILAGDKRPAWDVAPTFKWRHVAWIGELGIALLRGARAGGWDDSGKLLVEWDPEATKVKPEDRVGSLGADLLVVGGNRSSRQDLVSDLEYRADVLHVVGDAVHPASVCQAVHDAYRVALQV